MSGWEIVAVVLIAGLCAFPYVCLLMIVLTFLKDRRDRR